MNWKGLSAFHSSGLFGQGSGTQLAGKLGAPAQRWAIVDDRHGNHWHWDLALLLVARLGDAQGVAQHEGAEALHLLCEHLCGEVGMGKVVTHCCSHAGICAFLNGTGR